MKNNSITLIDGIRVGHAHDLDAVTGCTVILCEKGAVGGVDQRGGAPGTRETDALHPVHLVDKVHAVMLAGGSAFGLDAASGAVRYLEEKKIGYKVGPVRVPIVPAAILFDLRVGERPDIRPGPDCGYKAAVAASNGPVEEGNVGAGAGATVGKLGARDRAMKAGVGTSAIALPDGLIVAALVAVNAAGDIIDPATGRVIAGLRTPDGNGLADVRKLLRTGSVPQPARAQNTTIGVVATNARLNKVQANKVAQMAHDGLARAISPAHTIGDGDTLFALATGTWEGEVNLTAVGALAAEATADAIVRAALTAKGIPGYPAAADISADPP